MTTFFCLQRLWYRWVPLLLVMALTLSACNAQSPEAGNPDQASAKIPMGTRIGLTLTGYNYTNRYIDTFTVDGAGGGNLFVSEGEIGGGKSVCCVNYIVGTGAWKVGVRWQAGACTFNEITDSAGEKHHQIHSFFKEAEVEISPAIPDRPAYFEVHFYSDGHVEAAITERASPARLLLRKDRQDRSPFPTCPNDKKPEE